MKKIFILILIHFSFFPAFALNDLNNLTREEKKEILMRKREIKFAIRNSFYFSGSNTTQKDHIKIQLRYIKDILNKHDISHPEKGVYNSNLPAMLSWLDNFSKKIKQNLKNEELQALKEYKNKFYTYLGLSG